MNDREVSIATLSDRIEELERKVEWIVQIIFSPNGLAKSNNSAESVGVLRGLTMKQHGAAQLLVKGESNAEIAKRFKVSENTAKVYVRTLSKKFNVSTRGQVAMIYRDAMNGISDEDYEALAGLRKDWADVKSDKSKRGSVSKRNR